MAIISFSISQSDIDRLERKLKKIAELEYRRPIKDSLDLMKYSAEKNFGTQGFEFGQSWQPLKESTRKQREALGYGRARPILIRTGALRDGFVTEVTSKSTGTIYNKVDYSIYHQKGTRKMARRQILGLNKKLRRAIYLTFANYISKTLQNLNRNIL